MPLPSNSQSTIDTIVDLAERIARSAPDCAPIAMQIIDLARDLGGQPDQGLIQDALDAEISADTFSDVETQNAASAVAKALRD
ncbi:MAG TPA: hypothetical protein VGU24_15600 [Microvirga sp.]|jgi:hypothetical protein|nr:hypothetical protein [Microvirga sp.]